MPSARLLRWINVISTPLCTLNGRDRRVLGNETVTRVTRMEPSPQSSGPSQADWSDRAHALPAAEIAARLGVDVERGLSEIEARARLAKYGRNSLGRHRTRSLWAILFAQFRSLAVILLGVAAAISIAFGEFAEGLAIVVVLAINTAIGCYTEWRAVRSMEALHRQSRVMVEVRRNAGLTKIDARNLVPGDVVPLRGGDVVTADLRLFAASDLQCDESTLTGESVPVGKSTEPLADRTILAERSNLAFRGTAATRGAGAGIVVATGMSTELGRIAALAQSAEAAMTPLERRLEQLTSNLVWLTLAIVGGVGAIGAGSGREIVEMIETTIALAVAAIPEGLPVVATITLARGMWRMARRNALIERLSAVETLGATTVILTDKTGTLTQNRMGVGQYLLWGADVDVAPRPRDGLSFMVESRPIDVADHPRLARAITLGVLCAEEVADRRDPMEVALLDAGTLAGLARAELLARFPLVRSYEFDPALKVMATVHREGTRLFAAIKGAPEAVIARSRRVMTPAGCVPLSRADRAEWLERIENAASGGYRVLALAERRLGAGDDEPYDDLTLIGAVCLIDPIRPDVPDAVRSCRTAGVHVVMLTGDHAATAAAIARHAGIVEDGTARVLEGSALQSMNFAALGAAERDRIFAANVLARVSPENKLDLVALYQRRGDVVAMTGDGVNDAPALKKADIGIAMSGRGTEVAREAAAMVLKDDSFATIVTAIGEGRVILNNIRRFVVYLLSCNISEILVIGVATLAGLPLPLLPLQILYLNLVTDVFPAFAVAMGEGSDDVMRSPPRKPDRPIIDRRQWLGIIALGVLITASTLGAFVICLEELSLSHQLATTVAFTSIALAQLWNVFNMRGRSETVFLNTITRNPYVWAASALCLALIAVPVYVPALGDILGLVALDRHALALAIGASIAPLLVGQLWLALAGVTARG